MGTIASVEHAVSELLFWLRIMKEHAIFLKAGFECARIELIDEAQRFIEIFDALLDRAQGLRNGTPSRVFDLIIDARRATADLLAFKRRVLALLIQCGMGGSLYPLLVDHIAREAQEFLRVLGELEQEDPHESIFVRALRQEVFWLRQMADHAKFIHHLLDPSERGFIEVAHKWSHIFDRLLEQARDLESMLQANPTTFPTVVRFTDEVIAETQGLRDFKREAHRLLLECKILGIMPPLLADHVDREAEHFLEILECLRPQLSRTTITAQPN